MDIHVCLHIRHLITFVSLDVNRTYTTFFCLDLDIKFNFYSIFGQCQVIFVALQLPSLFKSLVDGQEVKFVGANVLHIGHNNSL